MKLSSKKAITSCSSKKEKKKRLCTEGEIKTIRKETLRQHKQHGQHTLAGRGSDEGSEWDVLQQRYFLVPSTYPSSSASLKSIIVAVIIIINYNKGNKAFSISGSLFNIIALSLSFAFCCCYFYLLFFYSLLFF